MYKRQAAELCHDQCACGRTGVLFQPGPRLDHRHQVREISFYETQVAEVLAQTRAAGLRFHLTPSERQLQIALEISEDYFASAMGPADDPKRSIEAELLARLGLPAEVRYVEPRAGSGPAA